MGKFHLERFFETKGDTGNGHDFSGETNLSERHEVLRDRDIASDGDQRECDSQVGGSFLHTEAARHIEVHIFGRERDASAAFQDGKKDDHAVVVIARRDAARNSEDGVNRECLDLYKDRTQSLHAGDDSLTRRLARAVTKQVFRRVFDPFEPLPLHDEEPGLCGGAETVLHRPQHTELIAAVAFQVEDHVDHVLQDARPREIPFLCHVTDDHDSDILTFREAHKYGGAVADLRGTSHRGFIGRKIHRLNGVDDEHGWLFFLSLRDDGIQIAAGIDEEIVISSA